MEPSLYIAKIAAVFYISIALGFLADKNLIRKMLEEYVKSSGAMFMGSIMALLLGFGLVYVEPYWTGDWRSMITLLGWLAIIKGIFGLIIPGYLAPLSQKILKICKFIHITVPVICIILAFVFGYFGFFAK